MDKNAKLAALAVIIFLVIITGYLLYTNYLADYFKTKNQPGSLAATSTDTLFDLRSYAAGRATIEKIASSKLDAIVANQATSTEQKTTAKVYTAKDLLVTSDTSSSSLKKYGLAVARNLSQYNQSDETNPIALTLEALQERNQTIPAELSALIKTKQQVLTSLAKISVPKNAIELQIKILNTLSQDIALLTDMTKVLDNPYIALTAANAYKIQQTNFYKIIDQVNTFFLDHQIIFYEGESGKIYIAN